MTQRSDEADDDGSYFTCPGCGKVSAYAYCDIDEATGEANGIELVGACSCFDVQCGHCKQYFAPVEIDGAPNPILHPAYTHADRE